MSNQGYWSSGLQASEANLDNSLLLFGPIASRPAAGNRGVLYRTTDTEQLFYDDGTAWQSMVTAAAPTPDPRIVVFTTQDHAITNTTAWQPVSLSFATEFGAEYMIMLYLVLSMESTGGCQLNFTGLSVVDVLIRLTTDDAWVVDRPTSLSPFYSVQSSFSRLSLVWYATAFAYDGSPTVQLQFTQVVASADPTTIHKGSRMEVIKL